MSKFCIPGETDLCTLTNAMTEFTIVLLVVGFYWPVLITECPREDHLSNKSQCNDLERRFAKAELVQLKRKYCYKKGIEILKSTECSINPFLGPQMMNALLGWIETYPLCKL